MHIPEETSEGAGAEKASQNDLPEMRKAPYDLADMLSRITDDNLQPEQSMGKPRGNEQW